MSSKKHGTPHKSPTKGTSKVPPSPPAKAPKAAAAPVKTLSPVGKNKGKGGGVPAALTNLRSSGRIADEVCREVACDALPTAGGYCRLHYIKNWKKIKRKELILKEGKLNRYIEELVSKYPEKYIEAIRQDLSADSEFYKVVHDLELDANVDDFENESESIDNLIDSIKRDIDDEGEAF